MTPIEMFAFEHLPEHLRDISRPFHIMATGIFETLPDNSERENALRKLLEAKDCAIRCVVFEKTIQ